MSTSSSDFSWAIPFMRAGYAGRGLTYVVIAGFALWAIWRGGQAEGTSTALQQLETTPMGGIVLALIALGLAAYAIWRVVDAIWDLEDYGSDGKGLVSRGGQVVTGLVHLAIGIGAAAVLFGSGGGGGESAISSAVSKVLTMPFGRWLVGLAGLATIGAGIYYVHKAWTESYRQHLVGNEATLRFNAALKAGVLAQGFTVGVIGAFILYAGVTANPNEAGGLGQTFSWLSGQVYGQVLVTILCLGLLGFALFCFVNARYRIVPKASDPDTTTLARQLKRQAS